MEGSNDEAVVLEIQGVQIECSRSDLIKNSDYFKVMFDGNFIESTKSVIAINGVDPEAMKIVLKVLWDREHPMTEAQIFSVLPAACMLQFLQIKDMCVERLQKMLSTRTCLKIWLLTEDLDLKTIYRRAKLLALLEFETVKKSEYILEMNADEIRNYLGNVYLQSASEWSVFLTMMKWFEHSDSQNGDDLLRLMHCLDFSSLTHEQVQTMLLRPDVLKWQQVVDALQSIVTTRNHKNAKSLLKSRRRNLGGGPCLLAENFSRSATENQASTSTISLLDKYRRKMRYAVLEAENGASPPHLNYTAVCLDPNTLRSTKCLQIEPPDCVKLIGFKVIGHKTLIFVFGGEYIVGRGGWNLDFHVYNVIEDTWTKNEELPYRRRHFDSCITGKYLFVVGGTGPFRVVQENMFWYNLEDGEWSNLQELLCDGRQIKCCAFNDQLFVLDIKSRSGYTFNPDTCTWTLLKICDNLHILPVYSENLILFAYKNKIYLKEDKLTEMVIEDDKLVVVNGYDIIGGEIKLGYFSRVESVCCNNFLYSLVLDEDDDESIWLEVFDVETMEVLTSCQISEEVVVDKKSYKFKMLAGVFAVFHEKLMETNCFVNEFN